MTTVLFHTDDLDELDSHVTFQPISRRKHRDQDGQVVDRRRRLSADDARDQGRKPRNARQFARSRELVF